jgi:AraC family transcriptional regulator
VFHPAGERHANAFCARGGRIFRLEMDEAWLTRLRDCGARLDRPAQSQHGLLSQIALRMFSEFRARDSASSLMIEGQAFEFVAAIVRSAEATTSGRAPAWLGDVMQYLHARAEEELGLDDVARVAGVHPAHLNRVFRLRHGCSVGEYVRRLRVDIAARELATSQRRIADIASGLGFADQSHFSRVFVKLRGITPGRFRKLHGDRRSERVRKSYR